MAVLHKFYCTMVNGGHARIQGILPGGVQAQLPENSSDNVSFFLSVLNLFYSLTEGVQWLFKENYHYPRFQRGVQLLPGGGGGGPNANFYRNSYNL